MKGNVEALLVNETSVSDIEMSVDFSIHHGFMVDWGLSSCWLLAGLLRSSLLRLRLLLPRPVPVVLALLVSWLCPGTCFQPCLWFIREWNDVLHLEGLCGAFGGTGSSVSAYVPQLEQACGSSSFAFCDCVHSGSNR